MMKSSRFEKYRQIEDSIIKDIRNLFRFKKEIVDTTNKVLRKLLRCNKQLTG